MKDLLLSLKYYYISIINVLAAFVTIMLTAVFLWHRFSNSWQIQLIYSIHTYHTHNLYINHRREVHIQLGLIGPPRQKTRRNRI